MSVSTYEDYLDLSYSGPDITAWAEGYEAEVYGLLDGCAEA